MTERRGTTASRPRNETPTTAVPSPRGEGQAGRRFSGSIPPTQPVIIPSKPDIIGAKPDIILAKLDIIGSKPDIIGANGDNISWQPAGIYSKEDGTTSCRHKLRGLKDKPFP